MAAYTRDQCEKWRNNKTVNPLTGRTITSTGAVYKAFKASCAQYKMSTTPPKKRASPKANSPKVGSPARFVPVLPPSHAMTAKRTKVQCEEWRKNKGINPASGRAIVSRGEIYLNYKKECAKYKPKTSKPAKVKPQKAIVLDIVSMPGYIRAGNYSKWSDLDIRKRYVFLTFIDNPRLTRDAMVAEIRKIDSERKDTFDDLSWDQLIQLYRGLIPYDKDGTFHLDLANPMAQSRQTLLRGVRHILKGKPPPEDPHSIGIINQFSVSNFPRKELVSEHRNAFTQHRLHRYGSSMYE